MLKLNKKTVLLVFLEKLNRNGNLNLKENEKNINKLRKKIFKK